MIPDVNVEDFLGLEYENNDVDTDRGTYRDRTIWLLFKSHQVCISEEDFEKMKEEMIKFDRGRGDTRY